MEIIIVLLAINFVAGEVHPFFVMRSRGIKLPFWDYQSPVIKKSVFRIKHNNKVFDALQVVQNNKLDITIQEIENIYNAKMDFNEIVNAMALAKNRNVIVSKEVLKELSFFNKDLTEIINKKNAGEEVMLMNQVGNNARQKPLGIK